MKKTTVFLISFFAIMLAGISCNDQKTAQEMLDDEKKATSRFISSNGFVILSAYPEDGVFGEKEFYKTDDGLYIHVIDSGDGTRARYLKDAILVRYEGMCYFKDDTTKYNSSSLGPYEFIYGNSLSYGSYGCEGWAIPLQYVGRNAVVSLIVPSALGNSYDQNYFNPVYYARLKYTGFY
ncbi:MAG: DUF4827 domain-containing protein [Dysgonamonadaceae bacterium]|jgi:hypothetical protein|nr:DUF4827 domain-containing protein [Dysgonamonadaceae bacterium]